jgi:CRISPR/Cas system-associated exonuclease Cas4 (RecB family)
VDEGADHSWFELDGVKMFAIPDFAFRDEAGRITVIDWKTGAPHPGHTEQVVGYALYLAHRHRTEPHEVHCRLVFLNAGQEVEVPVDGAAVQRFGRHFRESVQRMRELLVNAAANTPLDAAQFPMTEDLGQCARCAFRRACGREQVTFSTLPSGPSANAA